MYRNKLIARGLASAALVLCFAACSSQHPEALAPRSPAAAAHAMRTGDSDAYLQHTGKDAGLLEHARDLAGRYDPPAWLIAMGAGWREHSLSDAHKAMHAGDHAALLRAVGFGPQHVSGDILAAGYSIYSKRAGGMNYHETGPVPLDLIKGVDLPGLPENCAAVEVTLWGNVDGRNLRVRYGLGSGGVTNLQAGVELARDSVTLPPAALRETVSEALMDARFYGAEFRVLYVDGTIERKLLGRDEDGWGVAEHSRQSMAARLEETRDARLEAIRRRAADYRRTSGRWPRGMSELSVTARELVDPSAKGQAWAEFAPSPAADFVLADDPDGAWLAATTVTTPNGRRAITSTGEHIWIE
jgi:hypothetical protein